MLAVRVESITAQHIPTVGIYFLVHRERVFYRIKFVLRLIFHNVFTVYKHK